MPGRWRRFGVWMLAVLAAAATVSASARDSDGLFAVKGVGALNCAAYTRAAEAGNQELAQYSGYLAGYVSAYNEHQPETFDLLPWQSMETLMLIMLRRCRQVPDASFGVAVTEMARYFDGHKLEKLAERIRLSGAEGSIELFEPVVADVRAALEQRGYATDDLYTSLQQFRRDQHLPPATDNMQTALLSLLYTTADR